MPDSLNNQFDEYNQSPQAKCFWHTPWWKGRVQYVFMGWLSSYCSLFSNIVADNLINLSSLLQFLIKIKVADHNMFSQPVAFCFLLQTLLHSFSLIFTFPFVNVPVSCKIDLSLCIISLSHLKYFSRPHIVYIPASSPRLLIHRSLHISLLSLPVSPPWQPWPS